MFSWKVWMTFVIVCISCESRHLNSYISLTAMQPGLLVAGWSRSWSHGFNPDIKDLFLFRALLFTSRSCKGFLFPLLANAWLFGSLTLSGFDYLHLLNARFRDSLVFFNIFWYFAYRGLFCLLLNSLFLLLLAMSSFISAFPLCALVHIFPIPSSLFVVVHWSIVNRAALLFWLTLFTITFSLKEQLKDSVFHQYVQYL